MVGCRKLREQPAVGNLVIEDIGIAGVACAFTRGPERAEVERWLQAGASLVEDGDLGCVDQLDVVVLADIAGRVRWAAATARDRISCSVETQIRDRRPA